DDAPLGAAERETHQRALPGHPHRERLDLVARHRRVVADAALRRPPRNVVRDAVPLEEPNRAVVEAHRDADLHAFLHAREDVDQVRVDREDLTDEAKLGLGELQRVLAEVRHGLGRAHRPAPPSLTGAEYTSPPGRLTG